MHHHGPQTVHPRQILCNQRGYPRLTNHRIVQNHAGRVAIGQAIGEGRVDGRRQLGPVHGLHVAHLHMTINEQIGVVPVHTNQDHRFLATILALALAIVQAHSNQVVGDAIGEDFILESVPGPLGTNQLDQPLCSLLQVVPFNGQMVVAGNVFTVDGRWLDLARSFGTIQCCSCCGGRFRGRLHIGIVCFSTIITAARHRVSGRGEAGKR